MTRNQHDVVNDHFGTLVAEQIATGTPTAGRVPVSAGAGTSPVWTAGAAGATGATGPTGPTGPTGATGATGTVLDLQNASVVTPFTGIQFTNGAQIFWGFGSTSTHRGSIRINTDLVSLVAKNGSTLSFIDINSDGTMEIYGDSDITIDPAGHIDARSTGGLFFPPQHNADPTGVEGGVYYNLTTHKLRVYNGSAWQDCN